MGEGVHRRPSRLIGSAFIVAGLLTATIGVLAVLIVLPLGDDDAVSFVMRLPTFLLILNSQVPEGTPLLFLMLPGLLTLFAGYALLKLGRRHLVATYPAGAIRASGDRLLYLRPFIADKSPIPITLPLDFFLFGFFEMRVWTFTWLVMRGITRYEELIAYAFRRVGRLVTIGDPKERLPQLGASRVYAASSGSTGSAGEAPWKTAVAEQMAGARLILLHVGISDAIRWEIEAVVALADPQPVLLCVNPPGKRKTKLRGLDSALRAEVKAAWRQFRDACGTIFPQSLPETIGDARFVIRRQLDR